MLRIYADGNSTIAECSISACIALIPVAVRQLQCAGSSALAACSADGDELTLLACFLILYLFACLECVCLCFISAVRHGFKFKSNETCGSSNFYTVVFVQIRKRCVYIPNVLCAQFVVHMSEHCHIPLPDA